MIGALVFVVPGSLDAATGGSIYDKRMVEGLRARGWRVDVRELGDGFPQPSPERLAEAAHAIASIPSGATVVVDGLALGTMPDVVEAHAGRLRFVALIHLPLALEVGVDATVAHRLEVAERRALAAVDLVVATGRPTVAELMKYGVHLDRIVLIEPGIDRVPLAAGGGTTLQLLSVATVSPGKGHELLIRALASVGVGGWALTCVGNLERYPATVARVQHAIRAGSLDRHVTLTGELNGAELRAHYLRADLFVLATLRETYGMAVAEALAHGLPVVSTTTGAIPELVGSDAGLLVPTDNEPALAAALSRVLSDASLRAELSAGARRVRERLKTWDHAAAAMSAALERVPANG